MRFVAVDVETACSDQSSICQIGLLEIKDGLAYDEFCSFVNPDRAFDDINTEIHGISEDDVLDAPRFLAIAKTIHAFLHGSIVVSHGHFDRHAITKAYAKTTLPLPACIWIDSIALARWAWPEQASFKLDALAGHLGFQFEHHDAMEDARAAATVALAAIRHLDVSWDQVVKTVGQQSRSPLWPNRPVPKVNEGPKIQYGRSPAPTHSPIRARDFGGGEGPLASHRIVFTGELATSRQEAAKMAAALGAHCSESVSMKTTILVVGQSEGERAPVTLHHGITMTAFVKSGKYIKAERLNEEGASIHIIGEQEFLTLCAVLRKD